MKRRILDSDDDFNLETESADINVVPSPTTCKRKRVEAQDQTTNMSDNDEHVLCSDERLAADLAQLEEDLENAEMERSNNQDYHSQETSTSDKTVQQSNDESGQNDANKSPVEASMDGFYTDKDCPKYLLDGFFKTPPTLCNLGVVPYILPTEIIQDTHKLLTVSNEHAVTMDSASKRFKLIPEGDLSNFVQPTEGYALFYLSPLKDDLPEHILRVIFFYSQLEEVIKTTGLTNYVIPLPNQPLKRAKMKDKTVVGLSEQIVGGEPFYDGLPDDDPNMISITKFLNDREAQKSSCLTLERDPFTIRVAFTGALYEVTNDMDVESDSSEKRELFCVVIITPNLAFDLHSYIQNFLETPQRNPYLKDRQGELSLCYKMIQMYELDKNSGLFCDPSKFNNDLGGEGGNLSILSMLNLPYRIARRLKKMHPQHMKLNNVRVIGFPNLSFKADGSMDSYEKYAHRYINLAAEAHARRSHDASVLEAASDVDKKELAFEIPSPGGWPHNIKLDKHGKQLFCMFGLFDFPIVLKYFDENANGAYTYESFLRNIGKLPPVVQKRMQDFLTFNEKSGGKSIMPDELLLTSTDLATPFQILQTFYSQNASLGDDFKDSRLLKGYHAMIKYVNSLMDAEEMGPADALEQIHRHMKNSMERHSSILDSDCYGSKHLEQCKKIIKGMHKTKLNDIELGVVFKSIVENEVPLSIRHDPYLSSASFWSKQFFEWNRHARLNACNLEAAIEILLSSLGWLMDSHHHTLVPIMQGVVIMGGRGHYQLRIDKQYYMDWRKSNSTGVGKIQEVLNKFLQELCLQYPEGSSISLDFKNPNRNTDGALEQESCVVIVYNNNVPEVQSTPSREYKFQPLLFSEWRGGSLEAYIKYVWPRDGASKNIVSTTVDPKNTNERATAYKEQVANLNFCVLSSNEQKRSEEIRTVSCVTHVLPPGAPSYKKLNAESLELNDVKCDQNDGRSNMPDGHRLLIFLKSIFFPLIFAKCEVAMLHRSGAMPYRINSVSSAVLDWFYMLIKEHIFCVCNPIMIENYGRNRVRYLFLLRN